MKLMSNVTVSLGKPITAPVLIPVSHKSTPMCISDPFMVDGECYRVTALSFGTPHGAVIVDDVDSVDVSAIGAALGTHALFPEGASIVFIQVIDRENVRARLWQRDEGETAYTLEAIGVAGVASMMLHRAIMHSVNVSMGGNTFEVEWDRIEGAKITGPSELL